MKILIADKLPEATLSQLKTLGHSLNYEPGLSADDLLSALDDHQVLIVRSTKVLEHVLEQNSSLELIIRAGAGTNNIHVETASKKGIFVANCPGKNAVAVAELTMGFILSLDRRIPMANAEIKATQWNKKEYSKAQGVLGRTLGIIGLGTIGQEVIRRAQSFGLNIVGWSRSLTPQQAESLGIGYAPNLEELTQNADIISIHLAYTDETSGLISKSILENLKPNTHIINTSRGGILDEDALLELLEKKELWYATDVFAEEPGSGNANFNSTLAQHPHVISTPHIGASTNQAQNAVANTAVDIIQTYAEQGVALNCVNLCKQTPANWQINVRHHDQIGVLANVLGLISKENINVEECENIIFSGAQSACAKIRLGSKPSDDLLSNIKAVEYVLHTQVLSI
ncbi:MAG: NAD(P)-dependent oxidoreductase [Myxococcota bacterium]|jgi:D-3-phosphoglycerate dehydrogenase|nr:NAD(P)-dependent oxidoreductase [Myxococcota bacterium]